MRYEVAKDGTLSNGKVFFCWVWKTAAQFRPGTGGRPCCSTKYTPDEVLAAYDAVTADDLQRVAQSLFTEHDLYLAAVGPFGNGDELGALLRL